MLTITSSNGGQYTLDDVRWEVRDEIEVALQAGETSGTIECGGSIYRWSGSPRYQTVARCVEPDCDCDDRRGIILYDGPDYRQAVDSRSESPAGYSVETTP